LSNSSLASSARISHPPLNSFSGRLKSAELKPNPERTIFASYSMLYPPAASNLCWSSPISWSSFADLLASFSSTISCWTTSMECFSLIAPVGTSVTASSREQTDEGMISCCRQPMLMPCCLLICPPSGVTLPRIISNSVVLPAPFAPITAMRALAPIFKLMLLNSNCSPNDLEMLETLSIIYQSVASILETNCLSVFSWIGSATIAISQFIY